MTELIPLLDLVISCLPLLGLFSLFLIGYVCAMQDFKPKRVQPEDEYLPLRIEPVRKKPSRSYTYQELGIDDLSDSSSIPLEAQRRMKMEKIVREFSSTTPDGAASVIKRWLSD